MRTIPKFLSAGLIVTVCCCFLRLARAVRCCRVRLSVVRSHIVGRLSSISCFVSSMYFSRCAIPVYLCCGVSIVGGGKNFMCLYTLEVMVGVVALWCCFWLVQCALLYFSLRDLANSSKLRRICRCRSRGGFLGWERS